MPIGEERKKGKKFSGFLERIHIAPVLVFQQGLPKNIEEKLMLTQKLHLVISTCSDVVENLPENRKIGIENTDLKKKSE